MSHEANAGSFSALNDLQFVEQVHARLDALDNASRELDDANSANDRNIEDLEYLRAKRKAVEACVKELIPLIGSRLDKLAVDHLQSQPGEWAIGFLRDVRVIAPPSEYFRSVRRRSKPADELLALVRNAQLAPTVPTSPPTGIERSKRGKPGVKGKNVNARMAEMLQSDPTKLEWSARLWAEKLECCEGTVKGTTTWKQTVKAARALQKADRMQRPKRGR